MSTDWAAESEQAEASLSASIQAIMDGLRNNEQVMKAVSQLAEQQNLPPGVEQEQKDRLFDKEEQDRITRALEAQAGQGRRRKTRKTRRKQGKRIHKK
jgi:hypothetical protein